LIAVERWTGRETRALRHALRMTVVGFAEHLGVSSRTVSKWEARGADIEPLPEMQAALDTALSRAGPGTVQRFQALCPDAGEPVPDPALGVAPNAGPGPPDRRSGRPVLPVSIQIVEELSTLRASLVRSDSLLGPGRLIATVGEQVANVQDMLPSARGELRLKVFDLAALYAEFHGWLLEDIGQPLRGQAWTGRALEWSQAGENADLTAYTLMRRAQQAATQRDAALAIGLAQAAGRVSGVAARIRSASAQQLANGLAVEGEERQALLALDAAESLLAEGALEPADPSAAPYQLAEWCIPSYLTAQRANVLLTLGRADRAVRTFDRALAEWPQDYRRERGLHLARRARALAVDRRPEEAVAAGGEALAIAQETGSHRTLTELRTVARLATEQDANEAEARAFEAAVLVALQGR
jgi:tetratricopeptide (TPR) repeat protein/DNA-binding XRE family transcriptional regulator